MMFCTKVFAAHRILLFKDFNRAKTFRYSLAPERSLFGDLVQSFYHSEDGYSQAFAVQKPVLFNNFSIKGCG